MSYCRPIRWEPGETMFACDSCGFPYRFPSEMIRADNQMFYCLRTCWLGKTRLQDSREQAMARKRREEFQPPVIGKKPSWW